jgi:sugar/nucleoside kinase (ribokinase family)
MSLHLQVIGDSILDIIVQAPSLASEANTDTLLKQPVTHRAGGSGVNTLSHLRMNDASSKITFHTTFHTTMSHSGPNGALLKHHINNLPTPITLHNHTSPNSVEKTPHCLVITSPEDRLFYTYRGSLDTFNPPPLLPTPSHHNHLHVTGLMNFPNLLTSGYIARQFDNFDTTSVVPQTDASNSYWKDLVTILENVTFLICSESEAANLCPSTSDLDSFCSSPSAALYTAVTSGPSGSTVYDRARKCKISVPAFPVRAERIRDTTGSGDAFAAGFLGTILPALTTDASISPSTLLEACISGNAHGSTCCMNVGASTPLDEFVIEQHRDTIRSLAADGSNWIDIVASAVPVPTKAPQSFQTSSRTSSRTSSISSITAKHVILDFDRTLATIEVGTYDLTSSSKGAIINRVFGSASRLSSIKDMLATLKDGGVKLTILSYNSSHTIRKAFSYTDPSLLKMFDCILGFEDVETNQIGLPVGKGAAIKSFLAHNEAALFVDDSSRNIRDVMEAGGIETIWVKCVDGEEGGMDDDHISQILEWAMGC